MCRLRERFRAGSGIFMMMMITKPFDNIWRDSSWLFKNKKGDNTTHITQHYTLALFSHCAKISFQYSWMARNYQVNCRSFAVQTFALYHTFKGQSHTHFALFLLPLLRHCILYRDLLNICGLWTFSLISNKNYYNC